jgi:hypothetical protein
MADFWVLSLTSQGAGSGVGALISAAGDFGFDHRHNLADLAFKNVLQSSLPTKLISETLFRCITVIEPSHNVTIYNII